MRTISELKEQEISETPVVAFDCVLANGYAEHWSTHKVTIGDKQYAPRVVRHNLFDMKWGGDEGVDTLSRLSITLANADSYISQVTRAQSFKGAKVTARFLFFDLRAGVPASEEIVIFQGLMNPPDELTESTVRLSAHSRLNLQRFMLPEVRIQRRCPWTFPATDSQQAEAVNGGEQGKYSLFYRCGYSAGSPGGLGNLNGTVPFNSCDFTRAACHERGMLDKDSRGNVTRRFGGIEFVPASVLVRGHGERQAKSSNVSENEARYNDFVPVVYGTAWVQPPVVFARNDGNLTRFEALLGLGEIEGVLKVVVNGVEIPAGIHGEQMTSSGWYNLVNSGSRSGGFNLEFTDSLGNPLGDPYGSMAYLAVSVPNRVSDGKAIPQVKVLLQGRKLPTYHQDGGYAGEVFSNNPALVLLDLLRRSGWTTDEIDLASVASAAAFCEESLQVSDLNGVLQTQPRFQCNLALRRRRSVADIVRGIRTASRLYLVYGVTGRLEVRVEGRFQTQQPLKPSGSNSEEMMAGGWPAYEFGDGSDHGSGIARRASGESSVRMWSRSTAECPNRGSVEFQDVFNEYQQDSLSLVDVEDVTIARQEVAVTSVALGVANFHQAARVLKLQLDKAIRGNLYIEFETSVKGVMLRPGDLITVTYQKEGLSRQAFRVVRISPPLNQGTMVIEAQVHSDDWYGDNPSIAASGRVSRRRVGAEIGTPRALVGLELDEDLTPRYSVLERILENGDGSLDVELEVGFAVPSKPTTGDIEIPLLSLSPSVDSTGGSLAGGQTLYYAVTAVSTDGRESDLSFLVRAVVPPGTNTNRVQLQGLSFSSGTAGFIVYRGKNPSELLRIGSILAIANVFTDTGSGTELQGPPDPNFDHALFEWRLEVHPETAATVFGAGHLGSNAIELTTDEFSGYVVRVTKGKGAGQERLIVSHNETTLSIQGSWSIVPDGTSTFSIVEPGWQLGSRSELSPVRFRVPNRPGTTVQICGRAVNALGRDSGYDLAHITRWRLGGAGASGDTDVPPMPVFGLQPAGQGSLNVVGVGFEDLLNTRGITSGTLKLFFWNELAGMPENELAASIDDSATALTLSDTAQLSPGMLVQIEREIVEVDEVGGGLMTVIRGSHGTSSANHGAGVPVYALEHRTWILPFVKDFFGSAASGSFMYPIHLPDVRIAAADLRVTNGRGNGETRRANFTLNIDSGIRTLSGGQITIQHEGHLAIHSDAAPPLVVESTHAVRDIFAVVREAPTGGSIELRLRQDEDEYCLLNIPAGETMSNIVQGHGLGPLRQMAQLNLDVVSVPQGWDMSPGRDLTVTVRL